MTTSTAQIVVGVDGSAASIEALRWAATQAELTSATIRAVATWQSPDEHGIAAYAAEIDWADVTQRTLDIAIKEAGLGDRPDVQAVVLQGVPAHVLVDASRQAQLLVVGTRGHGGFVGLLLGSTSAYVIAHAACPVLVVRQPA
jgi:nucleotide-binding universal stress UspA family protein